MKQFYKLIALAMFFSVVTVDSEAYDFMVDGICYNKGSESNECTVTYTGSQYTGSSYVGDIIIPSSVTYDGTTYIVTVIDVTAFYCSPITSISMPNTIRAIGNRAFYGCSSLTSITIPRGVSSFGATSDRNWTFTGCTNLTSITWNAINCECSFSPFAPICTQIKEFKFGEDVIRIPDKICYEMSSLTSVVIPDNVSSIGEHAFYQCRGLTSISIGKNVQYIENGAFATYGNKKMTINVHASIPPELPSRFSSDGIATGSIVMVQADALPRYLRSWGLYLRSDLYTYLPMIEADVTFYHETSLLDYIVAMENVNTDTVKSVAFLSGMDEHLTEKWLKNGMNPNCLYYVYSDDVMESDNIINLKDCTADNIVLQDGFPFKCPATFTAKNAKLTYKPNSWADGKNGWEALCLPFEASSFKASTKGAISPILLGANGDFWLRKFVGASSDELYFSSTFDGIMEANTPYIVAFPGKAMGANNVEGQDITFAGKNVEFRSGVIPEVQKNEYVFVGNYDTKADEGDGWVVNSIGGSFENVDVVGDQPFRAYFKADSEWAAAAKSLAICFESSEEGTAVSTVEEDTELSVEQGADGDVIINSPTDSVINIYGADGSIVRSCKVKAGNNRVDGLGSGLYIINKQKILVQ